MNDGGGPRRSGTLVDWDDDRGFGFIVPTAGPPRLFAHVSEFPRGRRPVSGSAVTYTTARDARGRPQATRVEYVSLVPSVRRRRRGVASALAVAAGFLVLVAVLVQQGRLPDWYLGVCATASVVTFLAYGRDKTAAARGTRRTPESTLHTLAVIGGWPGALVARLFFRHKTIKQPFRSAFWLTVLAHCAALAWFVAERPFT